MRNKPGEHKTVQKRLLEYAGEIGWKYVSRQEAERRRGFDSEGVSREEQERAVPDYQTTPGNRGVFLFRRVEKNEAHFLTLTHWDSFEAIKAFTGTDISRAKYYPEDADFLLEFEPTVEHYELYVAPDNKSQ